MTTEATRFATPLPADNPLDLSRHIDHIGAPLDWTARFGVGHCIRFPMLCPVCRTEQVFIRYGEGKSDAYLMSFLLRGSIGITTGDGHWFNDDVQDRGLGVAIPLRCANSHRFLLNIEHAATDPVGTEPCGVSVVLDERLYDLDLAAPNDGAAAG